MPIPSHPLVPTRRQATVVDIIDSTGVGIVLGGDDPADTSKWVYASSLAEYPPRIGDTVIDFEHDGDHFVLGAPSWVGGGGLLAVVNGPGTLTDYSTVGTSATVDIPVVAGRSYRLGGYVLGTQVGSTGAPTVKLLINGSDSWAGVSMRPLGNNLAIAVGTIVSGYASGIWTASSTATATFSMTAQDSAVSFRIAAAACQLTVEDVGV